MTKQLLRAAAAAFLLANGILASAQTLASAPATTPATRPVELGAKMVLMIQEAAMIDAPGAKESPAFTGVLKRHSLEVPDSLMKAKPSVTLPRLTNEQIEKFNNSNHVAFKVYSKPLTNLLLLLDLAYSGIIERSELTLRIDMLEAVARNAPAATLRLSAAIMLLDAAERGFADPGRAIDAAAAATTESLKAAVDGRDTLSPQTMVSSSFYRAVYSMMEIDLWNLKDPTRESITKALERWDKIFASLENDAQDKDTKRLLGEIRKTSARKITDADVERILFPRQVRPLIEKYYMAKEKKDKPAMLALLMPTMKTAIEDVDFAQWVKEQFGGFPRQIRILSMGRRQAGLGQVLATHTLSWLDEDSKEHYQTYCLHVHKTDMGWRIGDK